MEEYNFIAGKFMINKFYIKLGILNFHDSGSLSIKPFYLLIHHCENHLDVYMCILVSLGDKSEYFLSHVTHLIQILICYK